MSCQDANTVLLLQLSGANGSTDFPDSSEYLQVVAPFGDAKIDTGTANPFNDGLGWMKLDGAGDYLTVVNSTKFNFAADFTIEGFLYWPTSVDNDAYIIGNQDHSGFTSGGVCCLMNGANFQIDVQNATVVSVAHGMSANTIYHFAAVRSGNTVSYYLGGNSLGSGVNTSAVVCANPIYIGLQPPPFSGKDLNGLLSCVRMSDVARYTANFIPPTTRFCPEVLAASIAMKKRMMMGVGL